MTATVEKLALVETGVRCETVERARAAQRLWAATTLQHRLQIVRKMRNEIACEGSSLLEAFALEPGRNRAEKLASEIIPLAEACRFLEREAKRILAPQCLHLKRKALWLWGVEVEQRRDPIGVVLIIGPANYPLFLPGVQALQALIAGNAVVLKPGRSGGRVIGVFRQFAIRAGVPEDLLLLLEEDVAPAKKVIAAGVDKIILTGSVETGREVYRQAAQQLTPLTLELSGCDPVFIHEGADLERAADSIAFGIRWNGGDTCIAPRRILVAAAVAEQFERILCERCPQAAHSLPIKPFQTDEEALQLAEESSFALGASVFGEPAAARAFAARVHAGTVVVNDIIAPTADPRVAFGGRGQSGFGFTRGAEGLRQLTAPKAVIVQRGRRLRHLEPLPDDAEELFGTYLAASLKTHWRDRLCALGRLMFALSSSRRSN